MPTTKHRPVGRTRVTVPFTADGSGNATVNSDALGGEIEAITYKPGTAATGVDAVISDLTTGDVILTLTDIGLASKRYPVRDLFTTQAGADIAAAATSTSPYARYAMVGQVKFVVAQAGAGGTGTFYIDVDDRGNVS